MAASQKLQLWNEGKVLLSEHSWRILRTSSWDNNRWESVDCVFTSVNVGSACSYMDNLRLVAVDQGSQHSTTLEADSFGGLEAYRFFLRLLATSATQGQKRLVKLIIPQAKGYIVRSDIIPLRLCDCLFVEQVESFARPLQSYGSDTPQHPTDLSSREDISLPAVASKAVAGILVCQTPQSDLEVVSSNLDQELDNRLSFPWIIETETPRLRRLALIEANSSHPEDGLGLYTAAAALGISLVVLDNPGHWLETSGSSVCEAFLPTRLTNPPTAEMRDNILASLQAYGKPIDGIVTFADNYWPYVAEAAKALNLPSNSSEGLNVATNKYLSSIHAGRQAYHVKSLDQAVSICQETDLPYPMIVKPCGGWSSEGVHRVDSQTSLEDAVRTALASRHGHELVIEPYCDGPEVDINLILQDGELLFFEVSDDMPKTADINGQSLGSLSNFHELYSVFPSKLPEVELQLLRDTFLAMLLSLGIENGVMHLEGRVQNSTVEYTTKDGIMMLSPRTDMATHSPKAWLIEINPRPPGTTGSHIIESTYGIDYWGPALLSAAGDKTRVFALAHPFVKGTQYTSVMVFIPADFPSTCEGIFDSDDICTELIARRPDLKPFISRYGCFVKRGQHVPHPSTGRNTFLGYFNIFSRKSREEALNIAHQIREAITYTFV
ncbi:Glutathione synthetase atp-binding [Trichophyton interdigitale]|uniref:Glutathione synthetase atp-binding n=1 Tax=Trichophyton interdigitale TaxID=101480 RepID=A0A9P5CXT7_9EURO|nr:Glutathione synthetase atp-binding [Trichophyton interdigitale]KAF3900686.1 Glutathione synthetase atp-binding [Trichophyton interdigitale]KAG8211437.1 Glutathione synthetase atp-binding [Trichophyton interdigitale]